MDRARLTALMLAAAATPVYAAAPAHMERLVTEAQAEGGYGTLGGYTYNPDDGAFWTVLYGSGMGARRVVPGFEETQVIYPTSMLQFMLSTDVGGGVTDASFGGGVTTGAVLLNPTAITIDYGDELDQDGQPIGAITYAPGQLAYILNFGLPVQDISSGEYLLDATKRIFRYDLRPVGFAQPSGVGAPDRNNAQDGAGGIAGAYNRVDWNDALSPLVSEKDLRDAAGYASTARTGSNFGRQFAWSTDGQSIYAVDSGTETGGIFRIDAVSGETVQVYREAVSPNLAAEPAVLHSSVRDFGSGAGDQVLFDGTDASGNDGGISYIVDDGTSGLKTPNVLLSGSRLQDFVENTSTGVDSLATDDEGNVYFYLGGTRGLFRYDTQGRLVALVNEIQLVNFNQSLDGGAEYRDSGGMKNLQVYEDATHGKRVFFRNNNRRISAVSIGKVGDFNDDDAITAADTAFFIDQFRTTTIPGVGSQALVDYARADLNGSGRMQGSVPGRDTPDYTGELLNLAVTHNDLDALRQFINLRDGDTDWNFTVDTADFDRLRANFDPTATGKSFFDGNSDYAADGDVDIADFQALRANFDPETSYDPEPGIAVLSAAADLEPGEVVVEVDVFSGAVRLVADGVTFESFQILASAESVLEAGYLGIDGFTTVTGDAFAASLNLTGSLLLDGALDLGAIYDVSLDRRDFAASFGVGATTSDIDVVYVPEPASAALLVFASTLLVQRRRKA